MRGGLGFGQFGLEGADDLRVVDEELVEDGGVLDIGGFGPDGAGVREDDEVEVGAE